MNIDEILNEHKVWLESDGKRGKQANLEDANLKGANLSGAVGIPSAIDFMERMFKRTADGYIAYKVFGGQYSPPAAWRIEPRSIISENVNFDRTVSCGCGINIAPLR